MDHFSVKDKKQTNKQRKQAIRTVSCFISRKVLFTTVNTITITTTTMTTTTTDTIMSTAISREQGPFSLTISLFLFPGEEDLLKEKEKTSKKKKKKKETLNC